MQSIKTARLAMVPAALLCLSHGTVWGNETELSPVVVTATRTPQRLQDVLADVSVVDGDTLARRGVQSLADVLLSLPGVEITRNGGPTATTSLFVRGGNTNHTVVMIDGIRIDTQSGSGGATCAAIPVQQIERIEVLRGPAAAVYGSDAMAGVVQVFTRQGEGGSPQTTLGVGAGTHGTYTSSASLRGAQDAWRYALGLGREISQGHNIRPAGNPDLDGYSLNTASVRLGWDGLARHKFDLSAVQSDANSAYDSTTSKGSASYAKDNRTLQRLSVLGGQWLAQWSDVWSSRVGLTQSQDRYLTLPAPGLAPNYVTSTQTETALWHNQWRVAAQTWTASLEVRQDALDNFSTKPAQTKRQQNGLALGHSQQLGAHHWQLNARLDNDSEFGTQTTGNAAYGYDFMPGWRATVAAGTAFRAPTLYQRFSDYGTPDLRPEQAINRELGVKYAAGGTVFSAMAYRTRISDLIGYQTFSAPNLGVCSYRTGCYVNTAQAMLQGWTLAGSTATGTVAWNASLDLQNPVDLNTGKRLARRAKQLLKIGAETAWQAWNLKADWLLSGDRYDTAANTPSGRLPGYGVWNLGATRPLGEQTDLLLRLDNVADKPYETAQGYATPGRTFFVGMKWTGR